MKSGWIVPAVMGWVVAVFVSVAYLVFSQETVKPVVRTVTKTITVKQPRTAGLKHLKFLDHSFGGVNGKGVTVTINCEGWWDTSTPKLVEAVGAEPGQVVYNICTARRT